MKNENVILMMINTIKDLGYINDGDRDSKRRIFFTITLPPILDETQNKTFNEITDCLMIYKEKE